MYASTVYASTMDSSTVCASTMDSSDFYRIPLTGDWFLWQSKGGHRTATDDILCAFAGSMIRPAASRVLDLGAGHGAVTLMLARALSDASFVAIEAQEISFSFLERNIAENGLDSRIRSVHQDLRQAEVEGLFDLITGSPPFIPLGRGTLPANSQRAAARFEMRGGIEAYCEAAARWLTADGSSSFLMDGGQDERCRMAIERAGLSLTRCIRVLPRLGASPTYMIYQAARRSDEVVDEVEWIIRESDENWTTTYRTIRQALCLPGIDRQA